ncbi:MAG: hypothetical protein WC622_16630 [Pedobacter sp.]|jgi:hypothetical protein|uniref:hypothetical protein n=1 Tax=Pedobacter sp. TaxID=1411316 RepID=UPI003569F9B0
MKISIKLPVAILSFILLFTSCKKDKETTPSYLSIKNTNWMVAITVTGNTTKENIFEFGGNETVFIWHTVGFTSYNGNWTQNGTTVNFTFKEYTTNGDYFWDNTGTLSSDGMTYTGTMQRRGAAGSGTFVAKKL